MKITDILVLEHKALAAVLDAIEQQLPAITSVDEIRVLSRLLHEVLSRHSECEDDIMFPALDHLLAENGQRARFHAEHQELDGCLLQAMRALDLDASRRLLHSAINRARLHFAGEEEIVLPLLATLVHDDAQERLAEAWLQQRMSAGVLQRDPADCVVAAKQRARRNSSRL